MEKKLQLAMKVSLQVLPRSRMGNTAFRGQGSVVTGFISFFLQGKCRITPMKSLTEAAYWATVFFLSPTSLL
jgi:hypothetical protein